MNMLARFGAWLVKASTPSNPEQWFIDWIHGGSESSAGIKVGPDSAQNSAIGIACVNVRSQDMAKLPLPLYRKREDGGREKVSDHAAFRVIKRPRPHLSSGAFREAMQAHCDLRGNAYARIMRDGRNRPIELTPLHPDWVTPKMSPDGTIFYEVRMWGRNAGEILVANDVLHIMERSDDGFCGKSVISRARDVVGMDLISAKHGAKLYGNAARPSTLLIPKGAGKQIGKMGRNLLKREFKEEFGGDNLYQAGVIGQEMEVHTIGMTNLDAQWIDGRKLSRAEVASIFRVPPHKVGIMDNATFSNIEHQSLEYVTDTLMPIARRWEEELNAKLLREDEKETYYFEFNFDALLRGDLLSRYQAYAQGIQWGIVNPDECREKENMNKRDDGEGGTYLVPLNMWPADEPRPEKTQAASAEDPPPTAKLLQIPVVR